MKYKPFFLGLFFILIGVIFTMLENTFYQYVDENGILHESLFIPLGIIFTIVGLLILIVFSVRKLLQLITNRF